jgi:transcriptional regulator with XRE-family HTH domain
MSPFGAELRRARRGERLTLAGLAGRLGCSTSYLSDLERGRRAPPRGELAARLEALLPASDLRAAAAAARGVAELPLGDGARRRLGLQLARRWATLDAAALRRLAAALQDT